MTRDGQGVLLMNAQKLKVLLAEREWTQGFLAKRAAMSQWELSRLMQGHTVLGEDRAKVLAKALGCEVEAFADSYEKQQ